MSKQNHRYRVHFTKEAAARFIGHLDLQSLFQKAFKRAALPVAYSEGFNPHQLLSFAAPLPLGTAGKNEILEIYMTQHIPAKAVVDGLNPLLPGGIVVLDAYIVSPTGKGAAALTRAAAYNIFFPANPDLSAKFGKIIDEILAAPSIEVEKKTKKGRAMADIRPDILALAMRNDDEICLTATLSTGSNRNLKPEVLVEYMCAKANVVMEEPPRCVRLNLLLDEGGL